MIWGEKDFRYRVVDGWGLSDEGRDHSGMITGVAVDAFSKLSYAAKLSDVSNEQLATGLKKLSQNMLDASAERAVCWEGHWFPEETATIHSAFRPRPLRPPDLH